MNEPENRPYIIGGLIAGVTFIGLLRHMLTSHNQPKPPPKFKCHSGTDGDSEPCPNSSSGKRPFSPTKSTLRPAAPVVAKPCQTVKPILHPNPVYPPAKPDTGARSHRHPTTTSQNPCAKTLKEQTPKARCEPEWTAGGENVTKPCRKICSKAVRANENILPWGCGERVKNVEPPPKLCTEDYEPPEEKKCIKKKCVSIDPAKRRWPLVDESSNKKQSPSRPCATFNSSKLRF